MLTHAIAAISSQNRADFSASRTGTSATRGALSSISSAAEACFSRARPISAIASGMPIKAVSAASA